MPQTPQRGRPRWSDVLTPAEWSVVEGVRHGMSNAVIASRQGGSLDAVKFHVSNALAKRGFVNRRQLQRWTGVRRDSALRKPREVNVTEALQLGAIGQIGRSVKDIAAAERWYRDVLGLPHLYTLNAHCLRKRRYNQGRRSGPRRRRDEAF